MFFRRNVARRATSGIGRGLLRKESGIMGLNSRLVRRMLVAAVGAFAVGGLAWAEVDLNKLPAAASKQGVTYEKDIKPILQASCFRCHGAERPKSGLRLDSLEGVMKGGDGGKIVVPGKSKE